jgi:Na+-transporting methylmalonyl-CoA/oxaloacetate decarboxylase gamma subunit
MMVVLVMGFVLFIVLLELFAAVAPMLVVIVCVPPDERHELAYLMAAADSSSRLRLWTALRLAVAARRKQRNARG